MGWSRDLFERVVFLVRSVYILDINKEKGRYIWFGYPTSPFLLLFVLFGFIVFKFLHFVMSGFSVGVGLHIDGLSRMSQCTCLSDGFHQV